MKRDMMKTVGVWAFLIGVIIAMMVGIAAAFVNVSGFFGVASAVMVVLGIIVGILNISEEEVTGFIIAAIGLATGSVAIANLGGLLPGALGIGVTATFTVFSVFVAGAVFVPALKAVYKISKD